MRCMVLDKSAPRHRPTPGTPKLADDLARAVDYTVVFRDFDWTVNATAAAKNNTTQ